MILHLRCMIEVGVNRGRRCIDRQSESSMRMTIIQHGNENTDLEKKMELHQYTSCDAAMSRNELRRRR